MDNNQLLATGGEGGLNLIPSLAPGGDSTTGPQRILSYIEFNDGRVCWYYPIFPNVYLVADRGYPEGEEQQEVFQEYLFDEIPAASYSANGSGDYPKPWEQVEEDETGYYFYEEQPAAWAVEVPNPNQPNPYQNDQPGTSYQRL